MQLSPSTPSDPNLFALLFSTAVPTPAAAPTAAPAVSPGEVDFEELFGPLTSTPGAAPEENLTCAGAESLFAPSLTRLPSRVGDQPENAGNAQAPTASLSLPTATKVDAPTKSEISESVVSTFAAFTTASEDEHPNGLTSGETHTRHRTASKSAPCGVKPIDAEAKAPANELAPMVAPLAPDAGPLPILSPAPDNREFFDPSPGLTAGEGRAERNPDAVFDVVAKQPRGSGAFISSAPRADRLIDIGGAERPAEHPSHATFAPSASVAASGNQTSFPIPRPEIATHDLVSLGAEAPLPSPDSSASDSSAVGVLSDEASLDPQAPAVEAGDFQPTLHPRVGAGQGPMTAANFAANGRASASLARSGSESTKKSFLTASPERVANRSETFGTGVANSGSAMPTRSSTAPLPHPTFEYADAAAAPSTPAVSSELVSAVASVGDHSQAPDSAIESASLAAHASEVSDAHRAVEVVLHAVDRVAERAQSAVNLEFSVGDADLIVRVELQDGEVHTTFRTDSADLRDALAQEWHAVVSTQGERGVRLAPAQFSGSDERPQDSFTGQNSSQQHGRSPAQRDAQPSFAPAFARSAHAATSPLASVSTAVPSRALAPAGTAQRLHLFA